MVWRFSARALLFAVLSSSAVLSVPVPARAALEEGVKAPDLALSGALDGKPLAFSLQEALKKGPVVLYFFPAAFTPGCTVEAHDFADAAGAFRKEGATLVGVTAGNTDRVAEFSKTECRGQFAVLADPGAKAAAAWQSLGSQKRGVFSERTSYVIAPDGKILLSYTDSDPSQHVARTLAALQAWRSAHP
ncbi:peroxiredoxin [Acetobacter sp. AN02]|uniref:peroxiredoxin n=1 Tax=Acetobacter sp. AN02 TaxID=2894186 RepID=UPI00243439F0|nr:peroxiredoxin [Acetobacter sp. AN02]MDG6094394.1 peroxiredoxin [Acetobacter sp. AN02]